MVQVVVSHVLLVLFVFYKLIVEDEVDADQYTVEEEVVGQEASGNELVKRKLVTKRTSAAVWEALI